MTKLRRRDRNRAVLGATLVGLALAGALMFGVVRYASQRPDKVNLGDKVFEVGDADRLALRIVEQGEPFLFKDPLTSRAGREVYVQHLGSDAGTGWLAIEAYGPGAPRRIDCILRWDRTTREFLDPCGARTFPADGAGLRTFPAEVNDRGLVVVDLRTAPPPASSA